MPSPNFEAFPGGMLRVAAVSPKVHVANCRANAEEIIALVSPIDADLVVTPELGITAYTCGDLFARGELIQQAIEATLAVAAATADKVVVVGLPVVANDSLLNAAAVLCGGKIVGIVPKSYLPTYREFYEARHFKAAGGGDPATIRIAGEDVPFGTDLLFDLGPATIAVEICEDFWTPIPPSSHAAIAGANVLVNLSASNETIGKADWRRDLVRSQSGRCIAAYLYCSAGPGESTSDLVFGGHCLIAENGRLLDEVRAVGDGHGIQTDGVKVVCDLDLERVGHDRRVTGSFDDARTDDSKPYRHLVCQLPPRSNPRRYTADAPMLRRVDATPFVPKDPATLDRRCAEVFELQTAGLVKRLSILPDSLPLAIGVSGGLDSTLSLLVAIQACDHIGSPRSRIVGITMPGFGTTEHTKTSADRLIELLSITGETIDIRPLSLDTFISLGHSPLGISVDRSTTIDGLQKQLQATPDDAKDLTFENVQARIRTMLLMSRGFVLGTGDMSEQALGWCTYNADHISMYNVNTSIPKTLVKFLVRYAADHYFDGQRRDLLHRVADTPISPELLPPTEGGEIRQSTEDSIGAYELHDFFLFHFVRNGFGREKILQLAAATEFESTNDPAIIEATYRTFERRFYASQFKRNCVPDGPKVGSVSLSPRGDWRMPSDAEPDL